MNTHILMHARTLFSQSCHLVSFGKVSVRVYLYEAEQFLRRYINNSFSPCLPSTRLVDNTHHITVSLPLFFDNTRIDSK